MSESRTTPKQVTVYTPESPLIHPGILAKDMFRDLRLSLGLAWRLMARDISAQYRQTALGYFWAVFPPLITSLVFILLNRAQVIHVGDINVPYPVFIFVGTVFWQLFVDALNAPIKSVLHNRALLSKINFPKEALIISAIGQTLFSFGIKLLLLILVLSVFKAPVYWTAFCAPLPILGLLCVGILIGVVLVPIGVLYQDIQQALAILTTGVMFLTPVLYPPPDSGLLGQITAINPLTPLFVSIRSLIFDGEYTEFGTVLLLLAGTIVLLMCGWVLYRIALPILIERMDA